MGPFYAILILPAVLLTLLYTLYYFGIFTSRAEISLLRTGFSFPAHWDGRLEGSTGFMRRNFVIFRKYSTLSIEIHTNSGTLDFEVKGPDGSVLSPASGTYGRNAAVLIDVRPFQRCCVTLRMDHFNGLFRIALQE